MKTNRIILALMLLTLGANVWAQNSNVMYSADRIPQNNTLNPAFFPKGDKNYVALTSFNISFTAPLSYSEIFYYDASKGQTNIRVDSILNVLSQESHIMYNGDFYLFGYGHRFGNTFITASAEVKTSVKVGIPTGLFSFLNEGNYNHRGAGNELSLVDGDLLHVQAYTEYALGVGHKFGDLTVGARLKLINGIADVSTANTRLDLYTSEDMQTLKADMYYNLHTSLPNFTLSSLQAKDIKQFILGRNFGMALDLGAKYEWKNFEFSAALLDLGSIHWVNVKEIVPKDGTGTLSFTGLDLSALISGGTMDTATINRLTDTINSLTQMERVDGEDYWTTLPTRFNLGATMNITKMLKVGALFHGEYNRSLSPNANVRSAVLRRNTTLLAQVNLFNWVECMASASIVNDGNKTDWFNPGFGVSLSLFKKAQLFVLLDYISDMYLVDAKSFNISFGLNAILDSGKGKNK